MFSKRAVSDSFSRFSSSYDEHAEAQKEAASLLVSFIKEHLGVFPDGPVLEIGCGTGFVTREIVPFLEGKRFIVTDISRSMVKECRSNLIGFDIDCSNCLFAAYDGESLWPENRFSMIFSGFAFQWFMDLSQTIMGLVRALKPGGVLAFSVQMEGSFKEWEKTCLEMGIPFTANPLPEFDSIFSILSLPGTKLKAIEREIKLIYKTSADFFRALKRIGAGTMAGGDHLSPSMMKKLIKGWDEASGQGVSVTYATGLFYLIKQS